MTEPILVSTQLTQNFIQSNTIGFIVSLTPDITKYNAECPDIPYYIYGDATTAATAIHDFLQQGVQSVIFTLDITDARIADIQNTYTELYG